MINWTPVSDGDPPATGAYLITVKVYTDNKWLNNDMSVSVGHFVKLAPEQRSTLKKWLQLYEDDVLAWAPMPEPYNPKDTGQISMFDDTDI